MVELICLADCLIACESCRRRRLRVTWLVNMVDESALHSKKDIFFKVRWQQRQVHLKHTDFMFPSYVQKTFRYSDLESKREI